MVYPFAFSFIGVSSLVSSTIIFFAIKGGLEICYYIGSGMCVVSLLILFLLYREKKVVD
jgi:hypothetical protein